ncbi:hypothetical protein IE077_002015, partial [Cardiosporidium cionae]
MPFAYIYPECHDDRPIHRPLDADCCIPGYETCFHTATGIFRFSPQQLMIKLFTAIFKLATDYTDCRMALKPYLLEICIKCIQYAASTQNPTFALTIIRYLFRAITPAGQAVILYEEFLPILPWFLETCINLQCEAPRMIREYWIEISLMVPVQFKSLVHYIGSLMIPIVIALESGNYDLVTLALRTLEHWIENLHHDYIYPMIAGLSQYFHRFQTRPPLMNALCKLLSFSRLPSPSADLVFYNTYHRALYPSHRIVHYSQIAENAQLLNACRSREFHRGVLQLGILLPPALLTLPSHPPYSLSPSPQRTGGNPSPPQRFPTPVFPSSIPSQRPMTPSDPTLGVSPGPSPPHLTTPTPSLSSTLSMTPSPLPLIPLEMDSAVEYALKVLEGSELTSRAHMQYYTNNPNLCSLSPQIHLLPHDRPRPESFSGINASSMEEFRQACASLRWEMLTEAMEQLEHTRIPHKKVPSPPRRRMAADFSFIDLEALPEEKDMQAAATPPFTLPSTEAAILPTFGGSETLDGCSVSMICYPPSKRVAALRSQKVRIAERILILKLIKGILLARCDPEQAKDILSFYEGICRHFGLIFASRNFPSIAPPIFTVAALSEMDPFA